MLLSILLQLVSSWLHLSCSVFALGSFGSFVLLSIRWLEFLAFWFENFKLFSVKAHYFRRPFIFCTFCLQWWGFETAPARDSPASVIGHVMTSRDYLKIEQVRTWLLSFSLAESEQFFSECFFQTCFSYFPPGYMAQVQFLPSGSCGSFVLFSIGWLDSLIFLVRNFQTVPRWSSFFQKALHFLYVLFVMMGLWNCACTW